ncbi:MAG: response regulator [Chloroflexota bacterium]
MAEMEDFDHVLVVEDERPLRQAIIWTLEDEGWSVAGADNGQEAVRAAADQRPSLIILDFMLPVMDGHTVSGRVREMYGDSLPILLITADGRASAKAQQVGAFEFLRKPFELEALVGAVRRGLSAGA